MAVLIQKSARSLWARYKSSIFKKTLEDPSGRLGFILVALIVLVAIFAPFLAPHNPNDINTANKFGDPSAEHWFGTDNLGRDTLSRLIFGARIALTVSTISISLAVLAGLAFGMVAGYNTGRVGNALVVFLDIIKSFPSLLFAIALIAMVGPSLNNLIIIITVTTFPAYARLIRAQTLRIKEREFIIASRAIGVPTWLIMVRHILPNVIGPLFIQAAMDIPVVITFEAGLSFLGLGVPPPTPSWGSILRTGYLYIRTSHWLVVFGGITLILATLGFTLFGEALRDTYDPRARKQ